MIKSAPRVLATPVLILLALAGGCTLPASHTEPAASPVSSQGAAPQLPAPTSRLIPTLHIAAATPWPAGLTPVPAPRLRVSLFANGLQHPRWLHVLPNGDVLVAETNAPPRPGDGKGIKGAVMKAVQAKAGAAAPTANRITLLRDADGDGVAEVTSVFIGNLNSPFGMALVGSTLYVANTDAIVGFPYQEGQLSIQAAGTRLTDLPAGPINHHWTKNIIASPDGRHLYATVGSNSNIAENGMDQEEGRAAIWEIDLATGAKRIYATGLRNPNGLAWEPTSGALWAVVNERDELGTDLVPDYLTTVRDGAFYGWPYSYYGQHMDQRVKPQSAAQVSRAIAPDYALGAHVAPLGLVAAGGTALPAPFSNGMFVAEHGSWNRKPLVGYKVVFIPFSNGKPAGLPIDVLRGFVSANGKAWGRPVGLALDRRGALLVADDVGNSIWRVVSAP